MKDMKFASYSEHRDIFFAELSADAVQLVLRQGDAALDL